VRGGHLVALRDRDWLEAYAKALAAAPWQDLGKVKTPA